MSQHLLCAWRSRFGLLAAVAVAMGSFSAPARAATPEEVDAAIDRAVKSILSRQKGGNWELNAKPPKPPKSKDKDQGRGYSEEAKFGGETAIATYALLAAGQSFQDAPMQSAIKWLESNELYGTYAVGLRSQVWLLIPEVARSKDKAVLAKRDRDCEWVQASRIHKGGNQGFYWYSYGWETAGSLGSSQMPFDPKGPPTDSGFDRSNSQYGVLGAWALEQAGCEIPVAYWNEEDAAWKKAQRADGGWNYNNDSGSSTYRMTSAGLATLFITQDYMLRANARQWDKCSGGVTNSNIERGLAYMDKHIEEAFRDKTENFDYGLYGIERIGVASGRKYFGTVDWFREGADVLVRSQTGDGSWGTVHDTCFALLFLVRGRAPVMFNKLQYENNPKKDVDPWNERPRDAANLAKWMGHHSVEGFFNWQIVNLKVPVEELHDSPILYLSGSEELSLSNQDVEKLRTFVNQGGIILGNADCGSRAFSSSFISLGHRLFPKYEFRRLPMNHPIFDEQYHASKWKTKPAVEGLSNGVRELMLLIPDSDLSRAWQTESTKTREEHFQLAGNIFLYSVDKENLHAKGRTHLVHAAGPAGRQIKLARLEAGDNPDPEPGAWTRQSAILHNEQHIDIFPEPVKLGEGKLAGYKVAHLTGTAKVILTTEQRAELKDFVTKGGTLIVDAAGGSSEFADSVETELNTIFGAGAVGPDKTLPLTDAVYAGPNKIDKVAFRPYARKSFTGSTHDPRIRGIKVGGREAVFYSREDLTEGLVGQPVDGVLGYEPKTASQLMTNMVMWGLKPQ
ncbi:MAG: A-macroglobulin complement component [Phycisphaerales bacterium]|nr:A-macroglobulin complement component [Phycisphaerales bacterium]